MKYAIGKDAKGHNGKERRNEVIGYVNLVPGVDVATQMQQYWDKMKSGHKNQMIHVIQSFSKKEFNPDDPNDLQMANHLGVEFAQLHYPGRQVAVFTQIDGKAGCVHNHIAVNNVSMEDYRACDKEQYYHPTIKKWTDKITEKYTVRDTGVKNPEKLTQSEKSLREVSKEYAKAMDIMADLYGISTSDFLSKALNGELDNMKMKRLPTPVEMFRVHRALKKDSKDLRKTIMESGADYEGLSKAMDDMDK